MNAPPRLYTPAEAAAYLGVGRRTLIALTAAGAIGVTRPSPRKPRYTDEALAAYVARVSRRPQAGGTEAEEVVIGRVVPNIRRTN